MSKQWNDDLRRRMEQYEAPAPDDLFNDIMNALPPREIAPAPSRSVALWPRRIAVAAAMVAIIVAAGYLMLTPSIPTIDTPLASSDPVTENSYLPQSAQPVDPQPALLADASTNIKSTEQRQQTKTPAKNSVLTATEEISDVTSDHQSTKEQMAEAKQEPNPSQKSDISPQRRTPSPTQKTYSQRSNSREPLYAVATSTRSNAGRLSASLNASGFAAGKNMHGSQQVFTVNSVLYGVRQDATDTDEITDMLLYNQEHTISSERHHRLPLRISATLRYNISDRWAIESGVTYSKLSSEASLGNKANYYDEHISLHYLGIPLNIVYDVWQSRLFTFYISGGGMVEKNISGSTRTDYYLDGQRMSSKSTDTSIKPLQWSVNAAAGVQFNFSPTIAIYAEPGIGYRFDNGTKIETLYNERPLDFNLGVGLRFTLR